VLILLELVLRGADSIFSILPEGNYSVYVDELDKASTFRGPLSAPWAEFAPYLFWRAKPGSVIRGSKINEDGFRGPEERRLAGKDSKLCLFLGDSITSGAYIDDYKDTFASRTVNRLNEICENQVWEGLNRGLFGYSSYQGKHLLSRVLKKRSPDLVVIQYGTNDARRARVPDNKVVSGGILKTRLFLLKYSYLCRMIEKLFKRLSFAGDEKSKNSTNFVRGVSQREYRQNLQEMVNMIKGKGAKEPIFLVSTPKDYRRIAKDIARKAGAMLVDGEEALERAYSEAGEYVKNFPHLPDDDLGFIVDEAMRPARRTSYLFHNPVHPNEHGASIISSLIVSTLMANDICN